MARKDRTGNRKSREQRPPVKIPELGYYLVVTDTEATERCYFQGLHKELPKEVQRKLVIKVVETKTRAMIDKCLAMTAYDAQYRIPWIVFDRDEVKDFDEIIREEFRPVFPFHQCAACAEYGIDALRGKQDADGSGIVDFYGFRPKLLDLTGMVKGW